MRERIRERWPGAVYYGALIVALPGLMIRASDTVGRALGIVGLLAVIAGVAGVIVLEDWRWQIGTAVAVVVLIGLAKANYQEISKRDARIQELEKERLEAVLKQGADVMKSVNRTLRGYAHDAVLEAVKKGTEEVFVPLRDAQAPDEIEWTAKFEAWDANNVQLIQRSWDDEALAIYTSDAGVISEIGDWRIRLLTHTRVRLERLMDISKRKTTYEDE